MNNEERAKQLIAASRTTFQQSKMPRARFLGLLASCGIAVTTPGLLTACGSDPNQQGANGRLQELWLLTGDLLPEDWDPYNFFTIIGHSINTNVYDRLVEFTPDLEIEPGLAESWDRVDDRTMEFRLRSGVTFHNGQRLTGEDVKASIEAASGLTKADPEPTSAAYFVPHEVEVVDDFVVRVRGKEPFAPLLNTLGRTPIASAKDIGEGRGALIEGPPNGTGPFRFENRAANRMEFAAFKDYWRGPAEVQKLVFENVKDPQTRLNALLSGQASIIDRVEPAQAAAIQKREDVSVEARPSTEALFLRFRMDGEPFGNNRALRRAVAWGIDRETLVDIIGGETQVAQSHLAPVIQYSQPQEPAYTFDPERAKAELRSAGVDGPVAFELLVSLGTYVKSREVGELITENLNEVGFDVTLRVLETAAWLDLLLGEQKRGAVYHAGWTNATPEPDNVVRFNFYSESGDPFAYSNKEVDELIVRGAETVDDERRRDIYGELQALLWEELPAVPLYISETANAFRSEVQGYQVYANYVRYLYPVRSRA